MCKTEGTSLKEKYEQSSELAKAKVRSRVLGEKVREAYKGLISVFGFKFKLYVRVLRT